MKKCYLFLFIIIPLACIKPERAKCNDDIASGEKTNGVVEPCRALTLLAPMLGLSGSESSRVQFDYFLTLCIAERIETERCEHQSIFTPVIDRRP